MQEVSGSIPLGSTISFKQAARCSQGAEGTTRSGATTARLSIAPLEFQKPSVRKRS
jgi:hypothetical protein